MGGDREQDKPEQIFSSFAGDPEMRELIAYFVGELPARMKALEVAWEAADLASLTRLAHQLKGSAGGFGFDVIGKAAHELEASAADVPVGENAVLSMEFQFRRLIDLCSRVASDASFR